MNFMQINRLAIVLLLAAPFAGKASAQTESTSAEPQHVVIDGPTLAAKRLDHTRPEYPFQARTANISGTVLLRVVISKEGIPTQIEIFAGADPLLDRAALDAVKQFRYTPAIVNGQPAEVDSVVSVIFRIGDGPAPRPAMPSAKVDEAWIKERRGSFEALDPNLVNSTRTLLDRSHLGAEVLRSVASRFVASNRPVIAAYASNQKNKGEVTDEAVANVIAKIDTEFLTDLVVAVYASHLSQEQIIAAAAPQAPPLKVTREIGDAITSGVRSALHDYNSKVLVPEIDAEIRRINKN
jgi:TonB family protein